MVKKSGRLVFLFMLATVLAGCSHIAYYAQAMSGHLGALRATSPIADIIRDPASDPGLRKKLEDVQTIREFASRELGLPDNNSYRAYADLGRPYVVWNVFAAPELSMVPKRWCMLMVGCVSYRGYYDKQDAERIAAELREEGYDTFVGGVSAYSTLGYFDDPVLNTILRQGSQEVARIVFHELAHQVFFVQDDSVFNESFATAVENEGMRRWLAAHYTPDQRAAFETQRERQADITELLRNYHGRFYALYETIRPVGQQREAKAALLAALRHDYADLKASWGGYAGYDPFFGEDLNNARLASLSLYSDLVPSFETLLAQQNHDLPLFFERVIALAALEKDARRVALAHFLPAVSAIRQASNGVTFGTTEIH